MIDKQWRLPNEVNQKIEADEIKGEYLCKKCKGWGYVNIEMDTVDGFTNSPVQVCLVCKGKGYTDWIYNAMEKRKVEIK